MKSFAFAVLLIVYAFAAPAAAQDYGAGMALYDCARR